MNINIYYAVKMDIKHKALQLLLSREHKGLDFDNLLEENIKNVCKVLEIEESCIKNLLPELHYQHDSSENIRWEFISLTFYILLLPEQNSDFLSITFLTNIKTAFQFIVSLGLLPNLISGVGVDMILRFKNIESFPTEQIDIKEKYYRLRSVIEMMLKCLEIKNLRSFLIEYHLNDILAGLFQITAAPLKKPDDKPNEKFQMSEQFYLELLQDRKKFQTKLHDLILNTHQPLLFRELMFLNGNKKSPTWLKNTVLQILMERVQVKTGVESLIRALFELESQDMGLEWKHWEILTKLLMTKPNYANENEYYHNICGQLIRLLKKRSIDGNRIPKFENAVILCTKYLYETKENICVNNFLNPLLKATLNFTYDFVVEDLNEITQNIFILHSIFIEKKTNKEIPILILKPIQIVLFELFSVTIGLKKSSLNQEIVDILAKFCSDCSNVDRKNLFEYFIFKTDIKDIPKVANPQFVSAVKILVEPKDPSLDSISISDSCVYFLEKSKDEVLIGNFVVFLLETFSELFQKSTHIEQTPLKIIERKIVIYQLLLNLIDNKILLEQVNCLKNNPNNLLMFSENFLKALVDNNIHRSTDFDSENFQALFLGIMIIHTVTKNLDKEILTEHTILCNTLRKISDETTNKELKFLIDEIYTQKVDEAEWVEKSNYEKAIDEVCSALIPEKAHGLATLVKLIEQRDTETCSKKQYVLNIFQQFLKSEESFLYLRGIQGLAVLADAFPNIVLEMLTDEYLSHNWHPQHEAEKHNETRMKIGEVLIRVTASLGEVAVKHKSLLLNTFLGAAKDPDPLIRASSLSNLGEVCKVLGFRLGTIITEILLVIHDVISNDMAVEVRRAAVSVIRQLFNGLGKDMISFLKDDILPIYRTLKSIYKDDPDTVTRLQAQLALEELNQIMKSLMAPETNLEKNFITPEV